MQTPSSYHIRVMTRDEVDLAVEWAAREGWNPGLRDAECYQVIDPNGFLIGLLDDTPIATISVVRYGDTFGFLGFYIVAPDFRGQGYGLRIWQAGMDYLKGRNVGLDGVVAQQNTYRKSGFQLAWRNMRFEGRSVVSDPPPPNIRPLDTTLFPTVAAYDRPFFPAERSRFLQSWIQQPGGLALGVLDGDSLAGYGVARPCRMGYKIGPLCADTPELAESLFKALQNGLPPQSPIFLDVPQPNANALALARRHGMRVVFETARMYNGDAPTLPLERLYGMTSFEVG